MVRRLESVTDPDLLVCVEIGKPRKTRGVDAYVCPYRVRGLGDDIVRAVYGVDAVQALELVMRAIGSQIANRTELRFLGNKDLGFPQPPPGADT